jgi:hypothetical protein
MGTLVHKVSEEWTADRDADLPSLTAHLAATDTKARSWRGREAEVAKEAEGYVDGLERAWDALALEPLREAEFVLRRPGLYIGTADLLATVTLPGRQPCVALIDYKTTAQRNRAKGVYGDSWTLQLAALAHAHEQVFYEWPDNKPKECGTEPWSMPEATLVIHLRGEGHFAVYEVPGTDPAWGETFGHLAAAHQMLQAVNVTELMGVSR